MPTFAEKLKIDNDVIRKGSKTFHVSCLRLFGHHPCTKGLLKQFQVEAGKVFRDFVLISNKRGGNAFCVIYSTNLFYFYGISQRVKSSVVWLLRVYFIGGEHATGNESTAWAP